jgi:hypothetical protein
MCCPRLSLLLLVVVSMLSGCGDGDSSPEPDGDSGVVDAGDMGDAADMGDAGDVPDGSADASEDPDAFDAVDEPDGSGDDTGTPDAGGDTGSDPVDDDTGARLLVTDLNRSIILTWALDETFAEGAAPALATTGSLVLRPSALAPYGDGGLFRTASVADVADSARVEVFDDLDALTGAALPDRTLEDAAISAFSDLAFDGGRGLLYVATQGQVHVYEDAGVPGFGGEVAPDRAFDSPDFANDFSNAVSSIELAPTEDRLWAVVSGADIVGIEDASERTGTISVNRKLTGASAARITYDAASDTLYVAHFFSGTTTNVSRLSDASTRSGAFVADATLTISGSIADIGVHDGDLYLLVPGAVQVYEDAASLGSGEGVPDRTVAAPPNTLETPAALLIVP